MNKNCEYFQYKSEIIATQIKMKVLHQEATQIVNERFRGENKRYNFIVKRPNATQETESQSSLTGETANQQAQMTSQTAPPFEPTETQKKQTLTRRRQSSSDLPNYSADSVKYNPQNFKRPPTKEPTRRKNPPQEHETHENEISKTNPKSSNEQKENPNFEKPAEDTKRRLSLGSGPSISLKNRCESLENDRTKPTKRANESTPSNSPDLPTKHAKNQINPDPNKTSQIPVLGSLPRPPDTGPHKYKPKPRNLR